MREKEKKGGERYRLSAVPLSGMEGKEEKNLEKHVCTYPQRPREGTEKGGEGEVPSGTVFPAEHLNPIEKERKKKRKKNGDTSYNSRRSGHRREEGGEGRREGGKAPSYLPSLRLERKSALHQCHDVRGGREEKERFIKLSNSFTLSRRRRGDLCEPHHPRERTL